MAQTSWPFENIDTSEAQFSAWARNIGEGIRADFGGELAVSADGADMTVDVLSGQALVRGHYYDSSSTEVITIPAADATNPRIDTLVLKLDPTANTISLVVVEGTPGASPSAPELTQTESLNYEFPLADIAVAANAVAISSGNVTDRRVFIGVDDSTIQKSLLSSTGDMLYASSASTPARLPIGSEGEVLTVASGIPSWASPSGGSSDTWSLVNTITLTSGTTSYAITGLTGTAYTKYLIHLSSCDVSAANTGVAFGYAAGSALSYPKLLFANGGYLTYQNSSILARSANGSGFPLDGHFYLEFGATGRVHHQSLFGVLGGGASTDYGSIMMGNLSSAPSTSFDFIFTGGTVGASGGTIYIYGA